MSDNEVAGATPADPGATPQTNEGTNDPAPAATADAEGLGEGGKAAIAAERKAAREALKRAEAAEKELEKLRTASLSEQEKAIAEARKAGAQEAQQAASVRVRKAEVRRSLTASGIQATELELAALSPDFGDLEVGEDGEIEGLEQAVTAFKAAHPSLFSKPAPTGSADGGVRGKSTLTLDQIKRMTQAEYEARRDEVMEFMAAPKH